MRKKSRNERIINSLKSKIVTRNKVYNEIFEQAENFKKNAE